MHKKKMIAPIVITIILLAYYAGFLWFCMSVPGILVLVKILGTVIPLLLGGVCVYVLIERIKEIRSGEEDDLSKY